MIVNSLLTDGSCALVRIQQLTVCQAKVKCCFRHSHFLSTLLHLAQQWRLLMLTAGHISSLSLERLDTPALIAVSVRSAMARSNNHCRMMVPVVDRRWKKFRQVASLPISCKRDQSLYRKLWQTMDYLRVSTVSKNKVRCRRAL